MATQRQQKTRPAPRVCGEDGALRRHHGALRGSPPRMRGRLLLARRQRFWRRAHPRVCGEDRARTPRWNPRDRLTPAYAGKTPGRLRRLRRRRAHPRVCGEDRYRNAQCPRREGSPPRMRGRRGQLFDVHPGLRLTPAYAGKTFGRHSRGTSLSAHPRVCGEDTDQHHHIQFGLGSPPRMRGRPGDRSRRIRARGLTPAYAGKTRSAV